MRIDKFGGTSVGDAARIRAVARLVAELPAETVVVVSAMGGVTNALLKGARAAAEGREDVFLETGASLREKHLGAIEGAISARGEREALGAWVRERLGDYGRLCRSIATLGECTLRGSDAVASLGEILSSRIVAAALREAGRPAEAVSATAFMRTDSHFGGARPDPTETRRLAGEVLTPLLEAGVTPVVTGYIGADALGATTTLGRGGSDYSAAILGAALDADEVWIWTDVHGILTADPRLVEAAGTLGALSYVEAEELARFGASVLHPRTVAPLAARGIPLVIANSFAPEGPVTRIGASPDAARACRPAIISSESLSLVTVEGAAWAATGDGWWLQVASRALRVLGEAGLEALMVSQSFSERSLNLIVAASDGEHAARTLTEALSDELALGHLARVGVEEEVAIVSVVGRAACAPETVVPRAYAALGELGVRVVSVGQAASAYSVSFVIAEGDVPRTVSWLHERLTGS